MRKLKLQVQISIDGYIAGPNGELDWLQWNWDQVLKDYIKEITDPVDCIVLGRKLAEGFIPYWADVADNPAHPEYEAGLKFTETRKVVFTKTLNKLIGNNTVLAKEDLVSEINNLKNQEGQDIIAYGGSNFVSALIKARLIDEFHFLVNPTAIGKGMPIFNELEKKEDFTLQNAIGFQCGIVVLNYILKNTNL